MLKRVVGLLISSLGSTDRLCIIAFAATPKRLMPLRRMMAQGQGLARSIIDRLVCSQEPVVDAFSKCISGLLSVVVQDLKFQIGFSHSSDPAEISTIYSCHVRPTVMNSSYILVGDLYADEEREYLVEMKVPISSSTIVGSRSHHHMFWLDAVIRTQQPRN
ncbi:Zinc finger (C3HC4-type RING finger) family protein [Forsythia ovata]|uniref:Zinc finger (C3HC4-type RING finger) family protein n=1 Tax=Forsythia ovata TaxID=205694 RepID=A0ABD1TC54_9LAMI